MRIPCPPHGTFFAPASAGLYSTLAGVLAGFDFVAVTYVLTGLQAERVRAKAHRESQSSENSLIVSLFCSFMALVVAAFQYAVLAAEQGPAVNGGRASSEELLAGVAFAFGTGILVFSLTVLISMLGWSRPLTRFVLW